MDAMKEAQKIGMYFAGESINTCVANTPAVAAYLTALVEREMAAFKSHDRCNAGMRSEIKTLTEALAAMRGDRDCEARRDWGMKARQALTPPPSASNVRETFKNKDGVIETCVSISQRELPASKPCDCRAQGSCNEQCQKCDGTKDCPFSKPAPEASEPCFDCGTEHCCEICRSIK